VHFASSAFELNLIGKDLLPQKSAEQWYIATVNEASMCCLTASFQEPATCIYNKGTGSYEYERLADLRQNIQGYSVRFKPEFWGGLEEWATQGKDPPPCLIFLQHTFPSHFKKVVEEVIPLREQAAACKLEREKTSRQLAEVDEQMLGELKQAMKQLILEWFPFLHGNAQVRMAHLYYPFQYSWWEGREGGRRCEQSAKSRR